MRLGQAAMEALRAEITGCLQPGDELAVVCPVGLKGTSIIAEQKKERLAEQFSAGFIYNCRTLFRDYGAGETVSVKDSTVWKMAQEAGVSALYAMKEGGFLSALWKMAEASQVGLTVDFRKVPIRQETIEVCEIFDINPYRLESEGSVSAGNPRRSGTGTETSSGRIYGRDHRTDKRWKRQASVQRFRCPLSGTSGRGRTL